MSRRCLILLLTWFSLGSTTRLAASPPAQLKEILQLLQTMKEKVLSEGKQQSELFDKFQCYCKSNTAALSGNIEAAHRLIQPMRSVACQAQHSLVLFLLFYSVLQRKTVLGKLGRVPRKSVRLMARAVA